MFVHAGNLNVGKPVFCSFFLVCYF